MTGRLKGRANITQTARKSVGNTAKKLCNEAMIDGLAQFTVEGIVEAKWKILGMAHLLVEITAVEPAKVCLLQAAQMDALLNQETKRAEVWQNLKEGLAEAKKQQDLDEEKECVDKSE